MSLVIDPAILTQLLGTAAAVSAVVWAVFFKKRDEDADQAQVDAALNWRQLAESREQQLRARDATIAELNSAVGKLESRFASLSAENNLLKELGNSASQIKVVADALAAVTREQHQETMDALSQLRADQVKSQHE